MSRLSVEFTLFASLLAGVALLGVSSCSKPSSSANNAPTTDKADAERSAKDYFTASVYPRIQVCGACHSGQADSPCQGASCAFIGATADETYSRIEGTVGLIAAPVKSPLVNYAHMSKDPRAIIAPEQSNAMTVWLGIEASARGLPGAVIKAKNLADAYAQFSACINEDVFRESGMADLAFVETDSDGPCLGCHNQGQGSMFLSADSTATLDKIRQYPFITKFVIAAVDGQGNFRELVASNRLIEKSNETCPGDQCHPPYGLSLREQQAVVTFVTTTLRNQASGNCSAGVVSTDAGVYDAGSDAEGGK